MAHPRHLEDARAPPRGRRSTVPLLLGSAPERSLSRLTRWRLPKDGPNDDAQSRPPSTAAARLSGRCSRCARSGRDVALRSRVAPPWGAQRTLWSKATTRISLASWIATRRRSPRVFRSGVLGGSSYIVQRGLDHRIVSDQRSSQRPGGNRGEGQVVGTASTRSGQRLMRAGRSAIGPCAGYPGFRVSTTSSEKSRTPRIALKRSASPV